ncbi:MAG: DUF2029 domain-containing protein [Methylobacteriaceae bacterium]|nr:DUF2029 domain-containing protein [Methylobacteriaceae bacterium]
MAAHGAAQTATLGRDIGYAAFFYPPPFLLICWPLAALPYLPALGLWLAVTGATYFAAIRRLLPRPVPFAAIVAFPAVLSNVGHGQNGFLTASLLAGAALALGPKPILAGLLVGALAVKPHLGLLLPFGLAFIGAWTTILAAAAAALALAALSTLAFGPAIWTRFLDASGLARRALEEDWVGTEKMQSVFAAARLLGLGLGPAYALQAAAAGLALAALWSLARRGVPRETYGVPLVSAALLGTPFLLDYDLTILAIPLAWLLREGLRTGFRPWEKMALAAGFVLPLLSRTLATLTGIPLGPLIVGAIFALLYRRAREGGTNPQRSLKLSWLASP